MPRYIATTRPGSRQLVFEPDGGIVELNRERLALRTVPRLRVQVTGGRTGLAGRPDDTADLVILDAFERAVLPGELATAEFARDVARVLRESGTYILNVADGYGLTFGRRVAATVCATFDHVALLAEPGVLRGRHFGNLIVVASGTPLPVGMLARRAAGAAFPARCLDGVELARFCGHSNPLTDSAPLSAPVPPSGLFGTGAGGTVWGAR